MQLTPSKSTASAQEALPTCERCDEAIAESIDGTPAQFCRACNDTLVDGADADDYSFSLVGYLNGTPTRTVRAVRESLSRFRNARKARRSRLAKRAAKALATTRQRGETLRADGYGFLPIANRPGAYTVVGSKSGDTYTATANTCTCCAFARLRTCKHQIGLATAIHEAQVALAQAQAFLAPSLAGRDLQRPVSLDRAAGSRFVRPAAAVATSRWASAR